MHSLGREGFDDSFPQMWLELQLPSPEHSHGAAPSPSLQHAEQARSSRVSSFPSFLPPPPALFVYYFHLLLRAVLCSSCFALLLHPCPALRLLVAGAVLRGSPVIFYITNRSIHRDLSKSREGRNIPLSTSPVTKANSKIYNSAVLPGPAGHTWLPRQWEGAVRGKETDARSIRSSWSQQR